MIAKREVNALLELLDDPDEFVFAAVTTKLLDYGKEILPHLEYMWENTTNQEVQHRVSSLIHRVHFRALQAEFLSWAKSENPDVFVGAALIAKYADPSIDMADLHDKLDQFKRFIWLEINNYMTPLEQVKVFHTIIWDYFKVKGHELSHLNPEHFFVNRLFNQKNGNCYSIGVVYLALCEYLDIPVFAVDIPRQFLFAYIDTIQNYIFPGLESATQILFYIDPTTGLLYTQEDVDQYLKKLSLNFENLDLRPLQNMQIIARMMEELILCYTTNKEEEKAREIGELLKMIK